MSALWRFARYIGRTCLDDKFPVWATLLGVVAGSFATYWIIPSINQGLETQKIRSEFIIRNLDDLNARTRSLVADVGTLHQGVLRTNSTDDVVRKTAITKIVELQWKAIELAIIFNTQTGSELVQNYQESLEDVRISLAKLNAKESLPASQAAIEKFSARSVDVITELAALGGLRIKVQVPRS